MQPSILPISRTFSSSPTETPYSSNNSPCPQYLATCISLPASTNQTGHYSVFWGLLGDLSFSPIPSPLFLGGFKFLGVKGGSQPCYSVGMNLVCGSCPWSCCGYLLTVPHAVHVSTQTSPVHWPSQPFCTLSQLQEFQVYTHSSAQVPLQGLGLLETESPLPLLQYLDLLQDSFSHPGLYLEGQRSVPRDPRVPSSYLRNSSSAFTPTFSEFQSGVK